MAVRYLIPVLSLRLAVVVELLEETEETGVMEAHKQPQ
jgi:hypothetical protein